VLRHLTIKTEEHENGIEAVEERVSVVEKVIEGQRQTIQSLQEQLAARKEAFKQQILDLARQVFVT
jgi:hypothetical protein